MEKLIQLALGSRKSAHLHFPRREHVSFAVRRLFFDVESNLTCGIVSVSS